MDRLACGRGSDLNDLGFGSGEADAQPFNFAEPTLPFSFGDPVEEVVADLHQPGTLRRIWPQERAADAGVLMDACRSVCAGAGADGNLSALEVTEEVVPLGIGGGAVLLGGPQGPAPRDKAR